VLLEMPDSPIACRRDLNTPRKCYSNFPQVAGMA
jgi:hypothetical protein